MDELCFSSIESFYQYEFHTIIKLLKGSLLFFLENITLEVITYFEPEIGRHDCQTQTFGLIISDKKATINFLNAFHCAFITKLSMIFEVCLDPFKR